MLFDRFGQPNTFWKKSLKKCWEKFEYSEDSPKRIFRGRPGDVEGGRPQHVLWTNICRLGASYLLLPGLVSLLLDGTVQSESTYLFHSFQRGKKATLINKTTNPSLWVAPPSLKVLYRNRGVCKLKKQFLNYPDFNNKHYFPFF